MISPSSLSPPATPSQPHTPGPCPYHRPGHPCDREKSCPVYIYDTEYDCTALRPGQLAMVRAWIPEEVQS